LISIVTVGEWESLALKADWGYQKLNALYTLLRTIPILDLDTDLAKTYTIVDAYSQGTLKFTPGWHNR